MKLTKHITTRAAALLLAVAIAATASATVLAAPPAAVVDETAYLLLDYYGTPEDFSIVKAAQLNGVAELTDYGYYTDICNMSTTDQPQLIDGGVRWQLDDSQGLPRKFYYEVTPQQGLTPELPWTLDISYRHNGVPARAEDLAGVSGVVSIEVVATPNPKASAYYRDNFLLMVAMMTDDDSSYSFEAPGAQYQSVGSYQMAFYAITPKQEDTMTFTLGSDCFESAGVLAMMMPATLAKLEDVSEMKEHKQNLADAGNATDAILTELLDIMLSMRGGMRTTADGIDELQSARAAVDVRRDSISAAVDATRKSMERMQKGLNDFAETLEDSKLPGALNELTDAMEEVLGSMGAVGGTADSISSVSSDLKGYIRELAVTSDAATVTELSEKIKMTTAELDALLDEFKSGSTALESAINSYIASINTHADDANADAAAAASAMLNDLSALNRVLSQAISSSMGDISGAISGSMNGVSGETAQLLDGAADTLTDTAVMLKGALQMLDAVDDTLKASGDALNNGARLSMDGLTQMLTDMTEALDKVDNLKTQKDIISEIVRDEWRRMEDDMGMLDIDTTAEKVSLTSKRNPAPRSLQIVLRSHEISVEDEDDSALLPAEEAAQSVGDRVKALFQKMFGAVANLFG